MWRGRKQPENGTESLISVATSVQVTGRDIFAHFILKQPPHLFRFPCLCCREHPRMHADGTHTNTLVRPFTHQLSFSLPLREAITQLPPLWQSSQITSIWIPPLPPRPFICFLLLPAPALSGLPLLYPCGSAPILSLSNTEPQKKKEKRGISIHTLRRSLNLRCTFSVATFVLFRATIPTRGQKRRSVSVWSACKKNRWHHGRKASTYLACLIWHGLSCSQVCVRCVGFG